jgi:predicted SprT family Zn-dependent metalloprotease
MKKMRDLDTLSSMNTILQVKKVVRETLEAYGHSHLKPTVEFNGRFSARLGDANHGLMRLRFSKPLWPRATKEQRYKCIVHEVAHLVVREEHGRWAKSHGWEWKAKMRFMGLDPDRCHDVPTAGVANKKARYNTYCKCEGEKALHPVTKRVYNIIADANSPRYYTCKRCRARLTITPQN